MCALGFVGCAKAQRASGCSNVYPYRSYTLLDPSWSDSDQGLAVPFEQSNVPHRQASAILALLAASARGGGRPQPRACHRGGCERQRLLSPRMSRAYLRARSRMVHVQSNGRNDSIVSQLGVDNPPTPSATPVPEGAGSVRKIFSRTSVFQDGMRIFLSYTCDTSSRAS